MPSSSDTVLLVDDDPVLRYLLARALADEGYPVLTAENGEQALVLASTLTEQLGLVVTDVRMPVMDGLQLARCLAHLERRPPVVFMSGFAADRDVPGPFLAKPFPPRALVELVGRMVPAHAFPSPDSTAVPLTPLSGAWEL